jgi:general secretion pathway protein L
MKQLLVLLSGDDRGSACLRDNGRIAGSDSDVGYADLPRADEIIAIVPAARMRTLAVALPPTPPEKRLAVVRYALEDQLAGDVDAQHLVIADVHDGHAVVHAIDRAWLVSTVEALRKAGRTPRRIVAESDLVPVADPGALAWVWRDDGGFLIAPDGRVGILDRSDETLPSGLLLSLREQGSNSRRVVVRAPDALAPEVAAWSAATGATFVLAPAWSWHDPDRDTFQRAPDLLTPELESGIRPAARPPEARWVRRAVGWGVAALALHVGATIADWAAARFAADRVVRETRQAIDEALPEAHGDPSAWRRAFAAARHARGRPAPDDLLPLLADTAVALSELPSGAVRVINYEAGQLTLDFDKAAMPALARAYSEWSARGIAALQAETPGALRARLTRE